MQVAGSRFQGSGFRLRRFILVYRPWGQLDKPNQELLTSKKFIELDAQAFLPVHPWAGFLCVSRTN